MSKSRGKFINTSEDWELNDWLDRNGYRETQENRDTLVGLIYVIKKYNKKKSSDNLTWVELDDYYELFPNEFSELEKKD